jgi:pimeloyl-ACP methyl ester carboxylesterase
MKRLSLNPETRKSLPGNFIDLPSGTTHYELSRPGSKDLVVHVHGFSTPYYIWEPTFQALKSSGFSVLRYDLLGRGYSDRPRTIYDLDLFLRQLVQLINSLKIDQPFHLVGLSFGAWISTQYCNHSPEIVKSLTLISPLVSGIPLMKNSIFNLPWIGDLFFYTYYSKHILPKNQSSDFFNAGKHPDWEIKFLDQLRYAGFNQAILSTYRQIRYVDWHSIYSNFSKKEIPLQIIWGKEDQTINRLEIECLQQMIPNHQLVLVDQTGHIPHYEKPEVVSTKMVEFLNKV